MMEEHVSPLAATTHLLQHTLRSLCIHQNSQWVYAIFWRILPRNYPPPKWDWEGQGTYDRSRGNRRNWILAWEDGFCNFAASSSVYNGNYYQGLQPELFFKMSHEIYSYGEGLIGKVAADHSHKWIYSKPIKDQEINLVSASADSVRNQKPHIYMILASSINSVLNPSTVRVNLLYIQYPRTWEAQFQCGIKTIALISVREGVMQLGSVQKVIEDPSHVVQLRRKLSYIESIPGVLLPHPSSSSSFSCALGYGVSEQKWLQPDELSYDPYLKVSPSMSSLEALLSKLPSVVPSPPPPLPPLPQSEALFLSSQRSVELMGLQRGVKEDVEDEYKPQVIEVGETSSSMHKRNVIS
ncbi:protein RICE SALT SENSITIVE 3-like isoform X2 [Prosopis cineraria]|uniref:protein RICE SALT SENSITIVE 3-like isoform X2 n=1 Tax=Prosopis cineraria TaxID=364024 RepID=UPI00240F5D62|nr:protein RICE SALT SENSITIVE 3-like isoform X2 [Prosopis cineraria]